MKFVLSAYLLIFTLLQSSTRNWVPQFDQELPGIERKMRGEIGVYIKNLGDNRTLNYKTDQLWYLSSTIKIPVAIAVLQKVEEGELSLDQRLTLKQTDFVDGSGDLLWAEPGTTYTIRTLVDKMVKDSDSPATDMLIRLLGEEELNHQIKEKMVSDGFNQITTIIQVRYDVYSEIHENARELSNMDIVRINSSSTLDERWNRLITAMGIGENEWDAGSIDEAFDRYYRRGINHGDLRSMGLLLERLYRGELLNEEHTNFLIDVMRSVTTGDRRIKGGLPRNTQWAHKTGTQIRRACNVGLVFPPQGSQPVIIAMCANDYPRISDAEQAFQDVGKAIGRTFLRNRN
jgi:beta-lactamase class A